MSIVNFLCASSQKTVKCDKAEKRLFGRRRRRQECTSIMHGKFARAFRVGAALIFAPRRAVGSFVGFTSANAATRVASTPTPKCTFCVCKLSAHCLIKPKCVGDVKILKWRVVNRRANKADSKQDYSSHLQAAEKQRKSHQSAFSRCISRLPRALRAAINLLEWAMRATFHRQQSASLERFRGSDYRRAT